MSADVQDPQTGPLPAQRGSMNDAGPPEAAPTAPRTAVGDLRRDYLTAFLGYLPRHDEAALHRAYEIGRSAVASGVGLLELARVHHEVFLRVLQDTPPEELAGVVGAASEFLLEVLAPHDMAQRVFLDKQTPPPS
jgi:hypothetical protein